jgi:ABC-type antimicrobial peptide transport system permease subunit
MDDFLPSGLFVSRSMAFAVRAAPGVGSDVVSTGALGGIDPLRLLPYAQEAVWSVNRSLPLSEVSTLEGILDRSMARTSFTLAMLLIAASVALALGALGIYGLVSYVVSLRAREIGIRMALGARPGEVSRMVLRRGLVLAGLGVTLGLLGAAGLTGLMSPLLYGVDATDPLTFAAMAFLLIAVSVTSTYLPARRASTSDPMSVLRPD